MKKIIAILLVVITAWAFVGCNNDAFEGTVTVVEYVSEENVKEYTVQLEKSDGAKNLFDVLEYLNKNQNVKLEYTGTGATTFVTAFGSLAQDASTNTYIFFRTSVESDWDLEYGTEVTYNDAKLVSSGVGAASAKLENNAVYYFYTETYSY